MKISTYLEEMCTNPYISLFFHDGRVDVLDSDGETIMSSEFVCLNCIQDLMNMKESWTDV